MQGCQSHNQCDRRKTFTAKFLKQVCKHFNFFGLLVTFLWQQPEKIFRVDKTVKNPEEQTREKLIPTEKKLLFYFFKNLSEVFVTFSEKLPAWLSKLQPTWLSKISRFNNFWESAQCLNRLLGFELIKVENIFEKKFSVFFTRCCASRGICWGKVISLFKKFYSFWCHFWKVSNFVVVLQNSLVTCLKAPSYVRKE